MSIYLSQYPVEDFRTSDLFAVSMFLKTVEDNLRSLLNVAMHYGELRNCCFRINDILLLPEQPENTHAIQNDAFVNEKSSQSEYVGLVRVLCAHMIIWLQNLPILSHEILRVGVT